MSGISLEANYVQCMNAVKCVIDTFLGGEMLKAKLNLEHPFFKKVGMMQGDAKVACELATSTKQMLEDWRRQRLEKVDGRIGDLVSTASKLLAKVPSMEDEAEFMKALKGEAISRFRFC